MNGLSTASELLLATLKLDSKFRYNPIWTIDFVHWPGGSDKLGVLKNISSEIWVMSHVGEEMRGRFSGKRLKVEGFTGKVETLSLWSGSWWTTQSFSVQFDADLIGMWMVMRMIQKRRGQIVGRPKNFVFWTHCWQTLFIIRVKVAQCQRWK